MLQAVRFPMEVGEPLSSVLAAVTSEPNWVQVGQQLATLKDNPGFGGMWIRRDDEDLDLVTIYGFNGVLPASRIEEYVEQVWQTVGHLPQVLGKANLEDTNVAVLVRAFNAAASTASGGQAPQKLTGAQQPGTGSNIPAGEDAGPIGAQAEAPADLNTPTAASSNPWVRVAGVLNALLALSFARSATATMLAVGLGGVEQEAVDDVQSLFSRRFFRRNSSLRTTALYTGLIDATDLSVHGQSPSLHSLSLPDMRDRMHFLGAVR